MKIKPSLKFYLRNMFLAVGVYYAITTVMLMVVTIILNLFKVGNEEMNFSSSTEFGSPTFCIIWGILIFTAYMKFMLQNGVSRKTMFMSGVLSTVILAFAMSIIDFVIQIVIGKMGGLLNVSLTGRPAFSILYRNGIFISEFTFGDVVLNLIWSSLFAVFLGFLGMISGLVFYRLSKIGRIIAGVGLGGGLVILLPIAEETITNGAISRAAKQFVLFVLGLQHSSGPNPYIWFASSLVLCAVIGGLSYLLLRRAAPQKA
ncbi:hypothetical protein [Scatolibacter rhodanostii]|uniref:hypothetical protein n=1 Tax=Scatolibacter rhodanostii TaxID=2014781 RepID=UPI000C079C97|nr:hypothetical protein [Scatolibacter rhodanostii]